MGFTTPKILFNVWFYFGLIAIIIAINYFWGKPLPAKKPALFFIKHKNVINKLTDTGIIFLIFVCLFSMLIFPISNFFQPLPYSQEIHQPSRWFEFSVLFLALTVCFGFSASFIGLLSTFQKNLTKLKRFILFIICLMPVLFTILTLLNEPEEIHKETIKLGLIYSINSWFINGPAIILGKSFFEFWWYIMCKLRIVAGELPE